MTHKKLYLLSVILVFLFGCKKDTDVSLIENRAIKDQYGRTLILHGLNTSSSAKYGNFLPWIDEAHVERETTWGMNVVRLLTSWAAIEPERGVYNEEYLNSYEEIVEWYTDREMYVLIDMHQDVYGPAVGGNGHPAWATETNGLEFVGGYDQWWLNNLDPATVNAYRNFWQYTDHQYLQDRYILAWLKMVERFKDNPYVIGYDLMNEPHAGVLQNTINGTFEKHQLTKFYNRLIPAIRAVDSEKYLFFEGQSLGVNFGLQSLLPKINDARAGERRLVYAPHCYPLFVDLEGTYDESGARNVQVWEENKVVELERHQTPMFIGEFSLSPQVPGFDEFIQDFHDMADRMQASWCYWSNDLGGWSPLDGNQQETPILNELIRTFPRAVSGDILAFNYDDATGIFQLNFKNNKSIAQPTEIFVPTRKYPNGWDLVVKGTSNYSENWDEAKQILKLNVNDNSEVKVTIQPK
jgi:endoglycosylceramidase